jgi:hypothetical protein
VSSILAIVGSVRFACPDGPAIAAWIVGDELLWRTPDAVTSGCAEGVDTIGENAAGESHVDFIPHPPKVRSWHGPGGFKERNQAIADTCTRLLRIACAETKTFGGGWTAREAQRQGKPVRHVIVHRDGRVDDSGWSV